MTLEEFSAAPYIYSVATRADDALVRDVLARTPSEGSISLSFRREPDAFAAQFASRAHGYVLARDARSGEVVGLCERVVRDAFVNGEICRLPYLAALRVLPGFRNRLRAVKGGFAAVRALLTAPGELPYALTSIMSDNHIAQRLLGAGLAGMPRYAFLGEFSTFALGARGTQRCGRAGSGDLPEISELLLRTAAQTQFACAWTLETLRELERARVLRAEDFLVVRRGGGIRACAALWDQSAHRQVVVAGYSRALGLARPLLNAAGRLSGLPHLPAPGKALRFAYLSHVAFPDTVEDLATMTSGARAEAARRGLDSLLTGWASEHSAAAALRALRGREFRSRLYRVHWPEEPLPALDTHRPLAPDLALL